MKRLNLKLVSIFIVLNILLVGLVSTEAMADPVQEQIECDLDLPVGPFLRLEGTDIELSALGQTLSGDFVFEKVTPPPSIITISPNTSLRSGLVVPIRGDDSSVDKRFAEGAQIFFGSREACADCLNITGGALVGAGMLGWNKSADGGQAIDWDLEIILPPGGILEIQHKPTEILIPPDWASRAGGRNAGNMYISAAYGTTRADVPICEFNKEADDWKTVIPIWPLWNSVIIVAPGGGQAAYWDVPIIITVAPGGTLDCMNSLGGGQVALHYDSGKADGTVDECQTVLGYGWTHNYNLYMVKQSSDVFMADGKGRMTRFQDDGMGGYTPSDGQTHTLTQAGPMVFLLEEVDGTTMTFEQPVPIPDWAYGEDVYLVNEIEDTRGRTIDFSYNGESLLQTITDPYGSQVQLSYADYFGKKLLHTITDPDMQVTMIEYQAGGDQLWRITDPEGNALTYNYDGSGRMTTAQLKDAQTWTCNYVGGKPHSLIDPNSDTYITVTNTQNWARDLSHPDSNELRYYPSRTDVNDAEGNITTLDLDRNGYVTEVGHPGHPNETFVFDSNLRLTEYTDQANNSWLYEYDPNGNLTDVNDPLNNQWQMSYEHPNIPSLCTEINEPDNDIWQFEWNSKGDLTKVIDPIVESPTDKVVSYSYTYYPVPPNGRYQFITRTDRNGNITQLELDPNGNIERTIVDPGGLAITTEYEHDAVGRMTRKTVFREAGGSNTVVTTYAYNSMGWLTETVLDPNPLNLTTQYEYDGCGRLVKITNPRGIATEYNYDYRGRLTTKTVDPCSLALTTGYSYDGCDRRITTTDAKDNQTNYEYDSLNRLIKIVDSEGYWIEYEYDERNNLTLTKRTIDPGGPPYRITKYEYDGLNRLIQKTADPCDLALPTQIEYAPSGGGGGSGRGTPGTSTIHKITDPEGKVTYYYYDQLDRLTSVVDKASDTSDNGGDADDAITNYEYDPVGNRISTVVENAPEPNLVTEYSYDATNRLIQQIVSPADANLVTSYTYDGTGSISSQTTSIGNMITYSYDKANRLINISDSIGPVASYSYDENSNLISHCDGMGHIWTYSYDNADRIIETYDPPIDIPTDKYTTYEYDKNNNLTKQTDNEGLATDYEYDGLNRLISTTKDPCDLNITNTVAYDGLDNKTQATDDKGNTTIYEYDGLNWLVREEFADGTEKCFSYDGVGNLIDANDQMGNTTAYTYDDLHRLISRTYADSNADTFIYDRAGQMLSADNNHSHIGHTYDGAGRTISTTQTDLPETYNYTVGYAYTIEPNNTRTITYPDGNEVTEVYDVRDRLIKVERDGSTIALYTYDDPGNRLLTKNFDNGMQSLYSYNDNDWVTKLVHKAPDDSNLAGFEYAYDAVGNCINSRNLLTYDVNKPVTQSLTFDYDSIYRLTNSKRGQWTGADIPSPIRQRNWTFDGAGNWQQFSIEDTIDTSENGTYNNSINQMNEYDDTSTNDPGPVPDDDGNPDDFMVNTNPLVGDFQPDGDVDFNDLAVMVVHWLDQDCIVPGSCGGADLDDSNDVDLIDFAFLAANWLDSTPGFYNSAHDKNGNLVDDDIFEYYWDYDHRPISSADKRARNLLTQVRRKSDGQAIGQYSYDAFGRRIGKTVGTVSTVFVYDGWRVVDEYENGTFARSYTYGEGIDEVLTMDTSTKHYYFHCNALLSTGAVTDEGGSVVERYSYDAYGQPFFANAAGDEISQSAIENPYLFTGRRYDEETGLYYYRTRYLHPQRGRFISRDTIGIWGGPGNLGNGYAYVGNNPVNYADPTGLAPVPRSLDHQGRIVDDSHRRARGRRLLGYINNYRNAGRGWSHVGSHRPSGRRITRIINERRFRERSKSLRSRLPNGAQHLIRLGGKFGGEPSGGLMRIPSEADNCNE